MRIGIGNDHVAIGMKEIIKDHLESLGHEVIDFGTDSPRRSHGWGQNPPLGNFGRMVEYGQCVAILLTGGSHDAPVALWFNAEAEWSGD